MVIQLDTFSFKGKDPDMQHSRGSNSKGLDWKQMGSIQTLGGEVLTLVYKSQHPDRDHTELTLVRDSFLV